MNKVIKTSLGVVAASAIVCANVATSALAWGDNSKSGTRTGYTTEQVTVDKVLGNKIVFNSITNNPNYGDERNFVSTRIEGATGTWNGNEINVEAGKTYVVRLYVHNNNPAGEKAVAKNVTTRFSIPTESGKELKITGFINSSNATPTEYWDSVVFKSSSSFTLDYIEGSAKLENNGFAKKGVKLSDNINSANGVKIGYNALDGNVPGCFEYDEIVTIKVKAVATEFSVSKEVRLEGEKDWHESVNAKVGDTVEFLIGYTNTSSKTVSDVKVKDVLPSNLKYVAGSTVLRNANHAKGAAVNSNELTTNGLVIGDYAKNANAYVMFKAKVVDTNLVCGTNKLVNWGQIIAGKASLQDSATVVVSKACKKQEDLPYTGSSSVISGVIGLGALTTATGYYIVSRKKLTR